MPVLHSAISRFLDAPGVQGAALVDAVTGLGYGVAGDAEAVGDGVECAELVNLIGDRLAEAGAEGELESVVVTTARRHLVLRSVRRQGDPLLVVAALDRERTNLALAVRHLTDRAGDVLA